jgi:hypothetical protein
MAEHRTKFYLFRSLRSWATKVCDDQQADALQGAFKYRGEGNDWVQLSITDPPGSPPRYFTIKITENVT